MATRKTIDIGFIGGGNMAEAIIKGLVASGRSAETMMIAEPDTARRKLVAKKYGVRTAASNTEIAGASRTIVLAVKPQVLGAVMDELRPAVSKSELYVSIAAGVMIDRLEKGLGSASRVVRVMPNTPCLVGKGASVICAGSRATAADVRLVRRMFASLGVAHLIDDEKLMHLVTAISGSGPAYVYRFAEALVAAAEKGGMTGELARSLAYQTIAGAAAMMIETGTEPADLRKAVSSPGGTTLAGLSRLDENKFFETIGEAVGAAKKRSVELSKA